MTLFRGARELFVLMVVASACSDPDQTAVISTTAQPVVVAPAAESALPPTAGSVSPGTEPLVVIPGFASGTVVGDAGPVPVLVASTLEQRRQGLMGVDDLKGWGGMWFEFGEVGSGGFWMKDTLLPLSIAWINTSGIVVAVADMDPCVADPCPSYQPGADYISALEVQQGQLAELGIGLGTFLMLSR